MELTSAGAVCLTAGILLVLAVVFGVASSEAGWPTSKTYARIGWTLVILGAAGMIVSIWLAYAGL